MPDAMTRLRVARLRLSSLSLVIGLVTCSSVAVAAASPGASALPAPPSPGASTVVLRMTVGGGLVPMSVRYTDLPTFTLYADGSAIFREQLDRAPVPGAPFPPLVRAQLSPEQADSLIAFALGPGGLLEAREHYADSRVMDAPTTVFDLDTPTLTKRVTAYALGINDQGSDAAELARLEALAEMLATFDEQVAAGHVMSSDAYHPARYRGILTPVWQADDAASRPWPFTDLAPADFVGTDAASFAELRPDQVALVTSEPNGGILNVRVDTPDGGGAYLSIRPLLPDEAALPPGVGASPSAAGPSPSAAR
jgi:hypothetical protein